MFISASNVRALSLLRYPRRFKLVAIVAVLLFAAALVVATLAAWRQENLTQSLREDTAWVVYKLDRDAVQLLNHLLAVTREPLSTSTREALNLRFELLYSRMTLLKEGEVRKLLQQIDTARELLGQIQQQLDVLDSMFTSGSDDVPNEELAPLPVASLEEELQALTQLTERLVIAINGYLAESATEERAQLSLLYKLLMTLIIGMSLAAFLLLGNVQIDFDAQTLSATGDASDNSAITMLGEVHNPGSFSFKENMTLLDALMRAEGVTRYADVTKIRVIVDKAPVIFDLKAYLDKPTDNINRA